jgi:hypothetical protein
VKKILNILLESDKTVIIADHRLYKASYDRIFCIKNLLEPYKAYLDSSGGHESIYFEPFEKGHGVTIGNSLRRILLSSIPGTRIT